MDGLTAIQDDCLRAITRYIRKEGRAPTRRELVELTDQRSTNGVNQLLRALAKKGCIRIGPTGKARNIVVLHIPPKQLSLIRSLDRRTSQGMVG